MINRRQFGKAVAVASIGAAARVHAAEPTQASKKGCCLTTKEGEPWRERAKLLRPAWMYSWGNQRPAEMLPSVEFVPMLWGNAGAERQRKRIDDLKRRAESGEIEHLLGFNEPDQHKQANMSVDRALELWPDLMEVGVPLVSPGCVHPDGEWIIEFMERAETLALRVDAVAVHSYMGPSVEILVRKLQAVHERFNRPLWLTELAVGDWKAKTRRENRHSTRSIAAFMRELLPTLDSLGYVHRYAWFSADVDSGPLGTSALFNRSGGLTRLGQIYAGHKG